MNYKERVPAVNRDFGVRVGGGGNATARALEVISGCAHAVIVSACFQEQGKVECARSSCIQCRFFPSTLFRSLMNVGQTTKPDA